MGTLVTQTSQVESVALWCSFIGSIVGIVLSIVAIVVSILTDRRSDQISGHTIQSLQEIESAVERSSNDTRELIKNAWDKLLIGSTEPAAALASPSPESSAKEIAAGIAAELRSELAGLEQKRPGGNGEQLTATENKLNEHVGALDKILKNLEKTLSAQLQMGRPLPETPQRIRDLIHTLSTLSEPALVLLKAIQPHHLSRDQYHALSRGRLSSAIAELRDAGLLSPAVHNTDHGKEPCYYMPPGVAREIRIPLGLMPPPREEGVNFVNTELRRVGYLA